jgi:hypothetical protein
MADRPRVAVLVTHWEAGSEGGWITRQVAGALVHAADVHIVTPDGTIAGRTPDGAFVVHRTATPVTRDVELRTEFLLAAAAPDATHDPPVAPDVDALLGRDLFDPWVGAERVLDDVRPDLVLVVGLHALGAMAAVEHHGRQVPVVLLALARDDGTAGFAHVGRAVARADSVLAVTGAERAQLAAEHPHATVRVVGAPLGANPSARSEPNAWVEGSPYVLVLADTDEDDEHPDNELVQLLRVRFPDHTVAVSHRDAFCAWHRGGAHRGWPIVRGSDLDRLLAWATATVDLRPGPLYARRCIASLLFGTPIVVPGGSRAQQHAERGAGGLWFDGPAELAWCVEAMLAPGIRTPLGRQGSDYAHREFGDTAAFIGRVVTACGLPDPEYVTA